MPKIATEKRRLLLATLASMAVDALLAPSFQPATATLSYTRHPVAQVQTASDIDFAARAAHIEAGLVPAIIVKGVRRKPLSIAERMVFYKVPGLSMVLFDHGRILGVRNYGFADVASKKPITADTLFQAGSISKAVTALGALRLVEKGQLSLGTDVNAGLRTWKVPENAFTRAQKVTVGGILSHSAGVTVGSFQGYRSDGTLPSITQTLNGESPANNAPIRVDLAPGSRWRYSGGGFVILQMLMIDVTHTPFPQLMRELVLDPSGMIRSTFEQPLPKNRATEAATPYDANGQPVKGGPHIYPEMAAAGLWTTPVDLAGLAIELENEYAGTSSKVLDRAMVRRMLNRQMDSWGFGIEIQKPFQPAHFDHGGGTAGYSCFLEAYTDFGPGLVLMTNAAGGGELIQEILRSAAKEYGWPDHHPIEILGSSIGGVGFFAAAVLVVLAYRGWRIRLRLELPTWRSRLGLLTLLGTFLSWVGLATLALYVLLDFNTNVFPSYWIIRAGRLTLGATCLGLSLKGVPRVEAMLAGLFLAAAWLTSAGS